MKIIDLTNKNISSVSQTAYGLCIGFFDGLHLGHKTLLQKHLLHCREEGSKPAVLTFDLLPKHCTEKNYTLESLEMRVQNIVDLGIEDVYVQKFSETFCDFSAELFLDKLCAQFKPSLLTVGYDFRIGKQAKFNVRDLQKWGAKKGVKIFVVDAVCVDNIQVHSKIIKQYLLNGELERANLFLSRPFSISGKVQKNRQIGQQLGFQTANIRLNTKIPLLRLGVYRTRCLIGNIYFNSISNFGFRPTVEQDETDLQLETHILDFAQDLYDRQIKVEFLEFIRPEIQFASLSDLKKQLEQDRENVRNKFLQEEKLRLKATIGDIKLYHLPSERFLTGYFEINCTLPLNEEKSAVRALLLNYLTGSNRFFSEKIQLNRFLNHSFDANLDPYIVQTNHAVTYGIRGQALHKFGKEEIFSKVFSTAIDCLLKPYRNLTEDDFGSFSTVLLEKEKENLLAEIAMEKQDKFLTSYQDALEIYFSAQNKPLSFHILGEEEDYQALDSFSLEKTYHELLAKAKVEVVVTGNFSNQDFEKIYAVLQQWPLNVQRERNWLKLLQKNSNFLASPAKIVRAKEKLDQTYLHIFYHVKDFTGNLDFILYSFLNNFLAEDQSSYLFQELREKEKLCYSIESIYKNELDLIIITMAVAKNREAEALSKLRKAISLLQAGNFNNLVFSQSKSNYLQKIALLKDTLANLVKLELRLQRQGLYIDLPQIKEYIANLTEESIVNLAKNIEEVFVYQFVSQDKVEEI